MSNEPTDNTGGVASERLRSIREHVEPDDSLAACIIPFIQHLSNYELAAINAGAIPKQLMRLLSRVAYNEIKLRRDA